MKQPVRDERWLDPQGETWQIAKVQRMKPLKNARGRVAFYIVRHASGITAKIMPPEIKAWKRADEIPEKQLSADPLYGRRVEITRKVRNGERMLVFLEEECPVRKGEMYHLTCGDILIERVGRKIVKGRQAEWHVDFVRHMTDRLYFLRNTVPAADPEDTVREPTITDIQHARIDGNYSHSKVDGGDELPAVPPDWVDRGRTERKVLHMKDRDEIRAADDVKRQRKAAKATLDATLAGLTPENQQILLAKIISECRASGVKDAA